LVAAGGLLVLELAKRDRLVITADWQVVRDATYGDTRVIFLSGRVS
jgi:hypothetical protein